MRCDVNVSIRPKGQETFGTKVEVKNMNSFSNMQRAIEFEVERQANDIRSGKTVVQETRLWDEFKNQTVSMRKKEGLADYRYFPEPDLPPLILTPEAIASITKEMPELPSARRERYLSLGLSIYDVLVLSDDVGTASFFDSLLSEGVNAKSAANWVMGDVSAYCNNKKVAIETLPVTPKCLAEMIALIDDTTISGKIAKDILPELLEGKANKGVKAFVESKGLLQISDEGMISSMVAQVLAANPKELSDYRGGKTKLQGFFQGAVMKESQGRVNPKLMQEILLRMLKG
jgi:aspartyl-tRNA(Asn)/glutamyl-tRNA(Gln) amidotransferase subunit B